MAGRVWLRGVPELDKKLARLSNALPNTVLEEALLEGAEPIVDEAKRLAPVLTGGTRDSIEARPDFGRRRRNGAVIGIFAKFVARFLEFGTSRMAAQPFLRPAIDAKTGEARRRIAARLWAAIVAAARG